MINFLSHIPCALGIHSWIEQAYSKNADIKADYCVNCGKEVIGVNYTPYSYTKKSKIPNVPKEPVGPPNTLEKEWEVE